MICGLGFLVVPIATAGLLWYVPDALTIGRQLPLTVAFSLLNLAFFLAITLPVVLLNRGSGTQTPPPAGETRGSGQRVRAWYWWIGAISLLAALGSLVLTALYAAGAIPTRQPPTAEEVAILAAPWLLWLGPAIATGVSLGALAFLLRWPTRTRPITSDPIIDELARQSWHGRMQLSMLYPGYLAGMLVTFQTELLMSVLSMQGMVAALVGIVLLSGFVSGFASIAVAIGLAIQETSTAWPPRAYV